MRALPVHITSPTTATIEDQQVVAGQDGSIHRAVHAAVSERAAHRGSAVRATITNEADGQTRTLMVWPDGAARAVEPDDGPGGALPEAVADAEVAGGEPDAEDETPAGVAVPEPRPSVAPQNPVAHTQPGEDTMTPTQPATTTGATASTAVVTNGQGPATPTPGEVPAEIGREMLHRPARRAPRSGWRRFVHTLTGGTINPGESVAGQREQDLIDRVARPIRGPHRIACLSLKGGVGKTTITVGLGSTFAALRGDHVVAIDANPDRGTLVGRIPSQTTATVRNLLDDVAAIRRYSDVRAFTSQAPSRLEVLASERDPHKSEAFSEADYLAALQVLENYYNLILSDCGTGLTHSAMTGVLHQVDSLVLVTSSALDGAQSADATLSWLEAQGHHQLVASSVVVVSESRDGGYSVNMDALVEHFAQRVRQVHIIPFDPHLSEGSEIDLDRLQPRTRDAFVALAATVADDFSTDRRPHLSTVAS